MVGRTLVSGQLDVSCSGSSAGPGRPAAPASKPV